VPQHGVAQRGTVPALLPTPLLTFSVTYWHRLRSWSPSGRISGSTMGTMPFCKHQADAITGTSLGIALAPWQCGPMPGPGGRCSAL